MKELSYLLLTIGVALALIAGVVFTLGDATTLVPPPEAVAESFVRELETRRYARAQAYLSEELAAKTGPEALKELTERLLQRTGKLLDVRGEAGWIAGERAEASARLKTELLGELALKFSLTRRAGIWSINDLQAIAAVR